MDTLSVMSTEHVLARVDGATAPSARWCRRPLARNRVHLRFKALELVFLEAYHLPPLFSFSAYIDIPTWLFLFLVLVLFFAWELPAGDCDANTSDRQHVFALLASILVALTLGLRLYLRHVLETLVSVACDGNLIAFMRQVSLEEGHKQPSTRAIDQTAPPQLLQNLLLHALVDGCSPRASTASPFAPPAPALSCRAIHALLQFLVLGNGFLAALLWTCIVPLTPDDALHACLLSLPLLCECTRAGPRNSP
ncbi:Aste57867_14071 [Aphanomyces stellatus]|uniref:Aste57867_14071 protein n=1 Tax=Aphanomyces stellatus TaxID=120398 RepID=A0A485L0N2_9STRA|nr:hypothetical protein As57867_014020 [Aphanomyces stellatus]VFT90899.1 Aste57867_14071 [Aphanomyces stellatus]